MKKSFVLALSALTATVVSLSAQESKWTEHVTPYGFFRTYAAFDTRDSKAGTEDLFYYVPYDQSNNAEGKDIYSNPSLKMYAITSRLGLNVGGFKYGSMSVSGKFETDFYLMNGSSAGLRLRQAYVNLLWDKLGYMENSISLKIGQAWHPMAADLPCSISLESGTPFGPFARSPQIMMDAKVNNFLFTAGILYPMQYRPTGPNGASEEYIKYSLIPEAYVGISYVRPHFIARVGTDFISLVPRHTVTAKTDKHDVGTRVKDRINMFNPFVYLQVNSGLLKINAKSVYASGGDHLRMMGGYALFDATDELNYKYTPLRSTVNFASFSYGKAWQLMCTIGYMKALGTADELRVNGEGFASASDIYYSSNGFKNINQMFRVTPTLAYNVGKFTVALEYDNTQVEYGDISKLDNHGLATKDKHWVMNHRVLGMVKFTF